MTPFGRGAPPSSADGPQPDRAFEFNDKRRIDPLTGELRVPVGGSPSATRSPFPAGVAPGDARNAGQPLTVTTDPVELDAAQQEAAERTADLQRITAEYANYRKRSERDRQQAALTAKGAVVSELLAVLDDLDLAALHGDLTGAFKAVSDRLVATLTRLGLTKFGDTGDVFDPTVHEAVQFATAADVAEPTVTQVLRHGYLFNERLLRAAVVGVTGPEHPADPDTSPAAAADGAVDAGADPKAGSPEPTHGPTSDPTGHTADNPTDDRPDSDPADPAEGSGPRP